ncbi:unnamed protein product [Mycetohabitans rhizoxinica HKI 454]|uniref:Uncharacterized protein n=1 Tax=Mycetohabitans rhizoxinica (strain DSM 19002 / CIP 109453 / HKI 454) TaxID=882378 RepID=E5ARK5_MYCRK|nr:unnamed protein product [Mycetohabitans rhizoxinica HKI 454]
MFTIAQLRLLVKAKHIECRTLLRECSQLFRQWA